MQITPKRVKNKAKGSLCIRAASFTAEPAANSARGRGLLELRGLPQLWESWGLVQIRFGRAPEIVTPEPGSLLPYVLHWNSAKSYLSVSILFYFIFLIFGCFYGINSYVREGSEGPRIPLYKFSLFCSFIRWVLVLKIEWRCKACKVPPTFVILEMAQKTQAENTSFLHRGNLVFHPALCVCYGIGIPWPDLTSYSSESAK